MENVFNLEDELRTKIKLSDGSEDFLFSRGPKISETLWPIQCFLCRDVFIMNSLKFKYHLLDDGHLKKLRQAQIHPPEAEKYREPYEQKYCEKNNMLNPIKIYPGEDILDITPKYKDRLLPFQVTTFENLLSEKVPEQLRSDIIMDYNQECPILGLCYGFKMAKNGKVRYFCALCNTNLDESNAYQHFVSKYHSMAYAKVHYPQTLELLPKASEEQAIDLVRYYYNKIEKIKGTRTFFFVSFDCFQNYPDKFIQKISKICHYNETTIKYPKEEIIKTFERILSGERLVPKFLKELPGQPESNFSKFDCEFTSTKQENTKYSNNRPSLKRSISDDKSSERVKKFGLDDSFENWERYRKFSENALQLLNANYKRYINMKEMHPKYEEEWRRFYKIKSEYLKRDGINPKNYDFTEDWSNYYIRFLEKCYYAEFKNYRIDLRRTLKLPFRTRTPSPVNNIAEKKSFGYEIHERNTSLMEPVIKNSSIQNVYNDSINTGAYDFNIASRNTTRRSFDSYSVDSDKFDHNTAINNDRCDRNAGIINNFRRNVDSHSVNTDKFDRNPVSHIDRYDRNAPGTSLFRKNVDNSDKFEHGTATIPLRQRRESGSVVDCGSSNSDYNSMCSIETRLPQTEDHSHSAQPVQNHSKCKPSVPISVLSILKLLAALENETGLFGHVVKKLLVKAVLYEKETEYTSNELLHEQEYFNLFVTSKEKLKGILEGRLVTGAKAFVSEKCIKDLEIILNIFDEYLKRNPNATEYHVNSSIVLADVMP